MLCHLYVPQAVRVQNLASMTESEKAEQQQRVFMDIIQKQRHELASLEVSQYI